MLILRNTHHILPNSTYNYTSLKIDLKILYITYNIKTVYYMKIILTIFFSFFFFFFAVMKAVSFPFIATSHFQFQNNRQCVPQWHQEER